MAIAIGLLVLLLILVIVGAAIRSCNSTATGINALAEWMNRMAKRRRDTDPDS